jgi:hypothetical protein
MARLVKVKSLRHRSLARSRKARKLKAFLRDEAARLTASATPFTFTAANATDLFTATAHGLETGESVRVSNSGGALPAESALAMVQAAFPAIGADVADKIIGPLKNFKPAAAPAPKETPNG